MHEISVGLAQLDPLDDPNDGILAPVMRRVGDRSLAGALTSGLETTIRVRQDILQSGVILIDHDAESTAERIRAFSPKLVTCRHRRPASWASAFSGSADSAAVHRPAGTTTDRGALHGAVAC